MTIVDIIIALLVFALLCWIVYLLPLPPKVAPLKNVGYIVVALLMIVWLTGGFGRSIPALRVH